MWTSSALWAFAATVGVVAVALYKLFGPGIDPHNPRVLHPLTEFEQQFLKEHIARGAEETGFLQRPRPRNQVARIFYRFWLPKHLDTHAAAKGVVVVLHGMNSHSARNNTFMVELLRSGFVVAGIDHEGMGRSDGRHGYFSSVNHLVEDAIEFIRVVKEKYKGQKVFLHGGSLGGLLVLHILTKVDKDFVDGAVILCPAVQIHETSRPSVAVEKMGKFLRSVAPKIPVARGNRGKNSSPEVAAFVDAMKRSDPLFYNGRVRIGTGLAILDALEQIQDKFHLIETPYLLQHGLADQVCHISGSEELHMKTSSKDKQFKTYPDGSHDLSNEPPHIRNAVVNDFVAWLEEQSAKK